MVGKNRRSGRRQQKLLGSHQKSWLWGRNAVLETLRAERWMPIELVVSGSVDVAVEQEVRQAADARNIPLIMADNERLIQLCGARDHQGLLAKMPPYPYESVDEALGNAASAGLFLILDSIQDPYNFGAICRSASVFGVDAVFTRSTDQVEVTSHVVRSSAGAVNRLAIAREDNLTELIGHIQQSGIRVVATSVQAEQTIAMADLRGPVAILIGNEGSGVDSALLDAADELVTIPQATEFDSLNAAVAAGILLYEVQRQRITGR